MFTLGEVVDMCIDRDMSDVGLRVSDNIGNLCCSRGLFSSGGVSVSECGIDVIRSRSIDRLLSSLDSFMSGNFLSVIRSRSIDSLLSSLQSFNTNGNFMSGI